MKKQDIIKACIIAAGEKNLSKIVMVGDSSHDATGAEQAGIKFIGVTYGFGFENRKEIQRLSCIGATDTARELLNYFE